MNLKKTLFVLTIASVLVLGLTETQAANDQEPGSIDWSGISAITDFWYVDGENEPNKFSVKYLSASSGLIHEHVCTDEDANVAHLHFEYDYGEDTTQASATVAAAHEFWDYRLWNSDISRLTGDATNKYNSHIYGFKQKADGGHYEYWVSDPSRIYTDEFVEQDEPNDVISGDLLRYGTSSHTSVVTTASGGKPTEIRWKMGNSGIYSYDSPSDEVQAFNTPQCTGTPNQDKKIEEQDWTWDTDYLTDPTVYRDD